MKEEVAKEWIAALRSGEYKRGEGRLHRIADNTFCCLGVLCDLAVQNGIIPPGREHYGSGQSCYGEETETAFLPTEVQRWSGIRTGNGEYDAGHDSLVIQNDNGMTFAVIADIIDREWREL